MRRTLKFLHEVGSAGLMGAVAAQAILSFAADGRGPLEYAAMRHAIMLISQWLLVPSLLVVLVSGLAAIAAHHPFQNAGWAWMKAATTLLVLEGTLVAVSGPAQGAAVVSARIAAGEPADAEELADFVRHERGGLGMIAFLSIVNIALAVWRPRFKRRTPPPPPPE
jgi:uncharacterized membrane protein